MSDLDKLAQKARSGIGAGLGDVRTRDVAHVAIDQLVTRLKAAEQEWPASVKHFRSRAVAAEARVEELTEALEAANKERVRVGAILSDYADGQCDALVALGKIGLRGSALREKTGPAEATTPLGAQRFAGAGNGASTSCEPVSGPFVPDDLPDKDGE